MDKLNNNSNIPHYPPGGPPFILNSTNAAIRAAIMANMVLIVPDGVIIVPISPLKREVEQQN